MDALAQFLRARLDEDEQAAHIGDATEPPLTFRQIGDTGVIVASDGTHAEECANGNWAGVAEHIVRHDPARVLAEVDAKRRILLAHGVQAASGAPAPFPTPATRITGQTGRPIRRNPPQPAAPRPLCAA